MTRQQLRAIQSITIRLANDNCSIMPSMIVLRDMTLGMDKKLFVSMHAETENGNFSRYLNACIGPKGGVHVYSETQY